MVHYEDVVIEDSPQQWNSLNWLLTSAGLELIIITADTGREGFDLFEQESPDTVLLDIGLPDINGYDVLRKIRNFSKTPVIIITVKNTESDIVKGLEMGADDYLVKPFGQMELLARIKAVNRRSNTGMSDTTTYGPISLDSLNQLTIKGKSAHLTPTEARILAYSSQREASWSIMKNWLNVYGDRRFLIQMIPFVFTSGACG